jgi:hypothetical protein
VATTIVFLSSARNTTVIGEVVLSSEVVAVLATNVKISPK